MYLVKLNAINSTNSYLKQLSLDRDTINWTVVTAEFQSFGRGQMQTKWESEQGKNLICSILIKFDKFKLPDRFYLNCAISIGIFNVLNQYNVPELKIKWPNDIMSANKKLGGILIENSLSGNCIYQTIVGIGLNVNQVTFPKKLSMAISMKQLLKVDFDRNKLLNQLVESIKEQINLLNQNKFDMLHKKYENVLFKKNKPSMFEDAEKHRFMGKIIGVTQLGKLKIELENEMVREFDFKELKHL
jgi:BirA family biotin operon repressor/biotin-[acetyl-CoA-carboxylase] ligase